MIPQFAVVGHPNKGKSSIVATLAQNDSIAISSASGTTTRCQRLEIPMETGQFALIDTPGFQRPSLVLDWLQQRNPTADQRSAVLKQFVDDENCRRRFPDEVELLQPILDGAAILYVVDGSRPYSSDYEAEMEILRWTGAASMALINPIGSEDFVSDWERALTQYFKVVRVFDALQADFDKQVAILETFAQLREDWRSQLTDLAGEFQQRRQQQYRQSAQLLASLLLEACNYSAKATAASAELAKVQREKLLDELTDGLRELETGYHQSLQSLFNYHHLTTETSTLGKEDFSLEGDLFETDKWIAWGLNRKQLTTAAAATGAAAGASIDVAMAGSSLLLGAVTGSAIAAAGVWLTADRLADFKIEGRPMGGYEARQGPVRNPNFPYVLCSRFLSLFDSLTSRTHAHRSQVVIIASDLSERIAAMPESQRKALQDAMGRLSKQRPVDELATTIEPLLRQSR